MNLKTAFDLCTNHWAFAFNVDFFSLNALVNHRRHVNFDQPAMSRLICRIVANKKEFNRFWKPYSCLVSVESRHSFKLMVQLDINFVTINLKPLCFITLRTALYLKTHFLIVQNSYSELVKGQIDFQFNFFFTDSAKHAC